MQLILFSSLLFSHPVMWKGAFDTTYKLAKDYSDLRIFYTFNRAQAVGFHSYHTEYDSRMDFVHYNHRLFRLNTSDSQQNLYGLVGVGQHNIQTVTHLGFQWDWETRRFFTMIKLDSISSQSILTSRVGVAPYLGAYQDLHTWVMLEYQSSRFDGRFRNIFTPLVRLFRAEYLFEIGFGEQYFVTVMVHF